MVGAAVRYLKQFRRAYLRRRQGVPAAPSWVQVEINNTCNLKCVMCPREAMTRKARYMTAAEFGDIADKCRAASVPRLRLFLMGEPLLHPELAEMIAYAKSVGIPSVEFNTNAALLTAEKAEAVIEAGLDQIVFSLDGVDAATYEGIRIGGKYDEVTAHVEDFCRRVQARGKGPHTTIQTIVMGSTREHVPAFRERWLGVADRVEVQCLREYQGVEAGRTTQIRPDDELRPCPALWDYLVILSDRRVVPCCVDINGDMTLGDIADTDIQTLWTRNPVLQELRAHHLRYGYTDYPLCRGCEFTNVSLLKRKARETEAELTAE